MQNNQAILTIAQVAHQINKAYCEALGDTSQVNWDDAPDWQKESALHGVEMHLGNPDAGAEASHESWLAQKEADGWVYGEVKDADAKTHPCILPFSELPVEQQAKDAIFRAVVHAVNALDATTLLPEVAASQAPVVQYSVQAGTLPIRYIANREAHSDNLYSTGIWQVGETKAIPRSIANKMLKHPDVYEISDDPVVSATVAEEDKSPDNREKMQETYDMVNAMEKDAIKSFIKTQFNLDVDLRKHKEVATLRAYAIRLADQYGMLE